MRQRLGEHHRLELPGGIRESDDAHLVAGAGLALLLGNHRAGEAPRRLALLHRIGEIGESLHTEFRQHGVIGVERMGGQIEAEDLEFLEQLFRRQPGRGRLQADLFRTGGAGAEHVGLAAGLVLHGALRIGHETVDAGGERGAVDAEAIEGAGRDQAFPDAAIDELGIGAEAEILEASKGVSPRASTI